MQDAGHQIAVRAGDVAAAFGEQLQRRKAVGNDNFIEFFSDPAAHRF